MRIMQVVNIHPYNVAAWYALTLSRLLQQAGHEVLVIALPDSPSSRMAQEMGLQVESLELNTLNPLAVPGLYLRMRRLVRSFSPHIINCHRGEAFLLWGLLRKEFKNFRLVRTRGEQNLPQDNLPNSILHRRVADAIIVTNSSIGAHFRNLLQVPKDKLWVICGGVDTQQFRFDPEGRRRVRAEFGYTDQDFVIGLIGRFKESKGHREVIRSVASLRHDFDLHHIRLLLIGHSDALDESRIRAWISGHGIERITAISGVREDIPACISALDAAAIPSTQSEAIARTALELMACGCPTVASAIGALPDLFSAKALIPAGDVPALTVTLARLAKHEHIRHGLRQDQLSTVSQLTENDFLLQTLTVYESLLS
ncbi:glycosyltransferase [Desulfocurvibacter africanus]|uniref:Glycosyl transferase group 1 n=1 Tax=Desulfocurvibacter africanus subsp. africanus str. Walvis Bay TaxID=690850 RepID=F3Z0K4_DESAF|nr:glycosyltransferase [Desulfocurvibacter africanus]EGJ52091.1 glycosyl transferase group 1 [Desulfocurvibacter africanus subsp. africanus str. Walvis Bay]